MYKPVTMLVVFLTIYLCLIPFNVGKNLETDENKEHLEKCIDHIIKKYFNQYKELTYVDMNSDNQEIIKIINSISIVGVISKTSKTNLTVSNESYLITAGDAKHFTDNFRKLVGDGSWNPSTRFLIIINKLLKEDLKTIFDTFLKFNVINVVVVDRSDSDMYTYNPFDNYCCGRCYEKIIEYGKCSDSFNLDIYPYKLVTGLKNCTFKVSCPHWPPYSMDPDKNKHIKDPGVEEYILDVISRLEHFKLKYIYSDDAEIFTMVLRNKSSVGPTYNLEKGETDMRIGGMLLTYLRAKRFSYIYGHLAYTDDITYQVRKATASSSWKNLYLEFSVVVWLALLFSFIIYFIIFIVLVRPKDKVQVCLTMFSYVVLNNKRITGNYFTKYLFIVWVIFAYLVNMYYQSILFSRTMHPIIEYQISKEADLSEYNIKPCVSQIIRAFMLAENYTFEENEHSDCEKMLESMHTISHPSNLYTVVIHSLYTFNELNYYDKFGESMLYTFNRPLCKIIYAIYLYKGFPLLDKLFVHTLRLRENGLIDKYLRHLHWKNNKGYSFVEKVRKPYSKVPWRVLVVGYTLSFLTLVLEIIIKWYNDRRTSIMNC